MSIGHPKDFTDEELIEELESRGHKVVYQIPLAFLYTLGTDKNHKILTDIKKDWADSGSGLWEERELFAAYIPPEYVKYRERTDPKPETPNA